MQGDPRSREPWRRWEDGRRAESRHAGPKQRGAHPAVRVERKKWRVAVTTDWFKEGLSDR